MMEPPEEPEDEEEAGEEALIVFLIRYSPGIFGFVSVNSPVKALAYYPTPLSDEQMRRLTI